MKYCILTRKYLISLKFYRRLSLNLWNQHYTLELRKEIEAYWSTKLHHEDFSDKQYLKNKTYVLSMFPYPSGNLHIGHISVYTVSDTMARFYRMNGKNVFHPMGWDAFGLPAENAALERGIQPSDWTRQNITSMKNQLKKFSYTFDWKSELSTCSPDYYRWTQHIFLKMFDAGLVYQNEALVNWDPVNETVLADEQVDDENRSWRSGVKVKKKLLKQWFVRTTKFAKDLRDGLNDETLSVGWNDTKDVQKDWIGECDGYSFDFELQNAGIKSLNIWLRDPAMVPNARFIFVKPNSTVDLVSGDNCGTERKLRIAALNPFNNETLPIYVRNDAPFPVGRDAYLGVPAASETDAIFAANESLPACVECAAATDDSKTLCETAKKLNIGGYPVSSKLKDWLVSRQRYWGTPVPIVHCSICGTVPVPLHELPVILPSLPNDFSIGNNLNMFLRTSDWVRTKCPKCKGEAVRETDTLDTFVDSSWYFLRYTDVNNDSEPFSSRIANQSMPVDLYVGGLDHALLHLYYARFTNYFLHSIGMVEYREPFRRLLLHGVVKGRTYKTTNGMYVKPEEIEIEGDKVTHTKTGDELITTWEKMSKSKYNGVDPDDVLNVYGVDTTRLVLLNNIATNTTLNWSDELFKVVFSWQHRLWLTIRELIKVREDPLLPMVADMEKAEKYLRDRRNYFVKITSHRFAVTQELSYENGVIDALMKFTKILRVPAREVRKYSGEYERALAALIIMLTPMAPYFAATLWYGFTNAPSRINVDSDEIKWDEDVTKQKWPRLDSYYKVPISYTVNKCSVCDVNTSSAKLETLTEDSAVEYGKRHPKLKNVLDGKTIKNVRLAVEYPHGALCYITTANDT